MDAMERNEMTVPDALVHFATAPFRLRTYTNLIYLLLAFPLGLLYFLFLVVGLSVGLGLTIVWIGIPVLAVVFAGSWALAAFERQLAIHALGAEVPPMTPPPAGESRTLWQQVTAFFLNPVTWKGMAFLLLKFPLGVASFVSVVTLIATSSALVLAPIAWEWGAFDVDLVFWQVDSLGGAWLCSLIGLGLLLLSLNLLNLLALVWRWSAIFLLGSERYAAAPPAPPVVPAAMALA
jgi:putative sensor protein